MERVIIPYTTEEEWLEHRLNDLTSSDIPTLFGVGYKNYEELLKEKSARVIGTFTFNERIDWGIALQDAIANEFARQNKWTIRKKTEYIRIPELRIGSSFDFEIMERPSSDTPNISRINLIKDGYELLEIKNVDSLEYKNKWITTGFEIEATPYIELQVQHQLLVSGLQVAYIGGLIGGNKGVLLRREANPKIHKAILEKAEKFWKEVNK